LTTEVVSLKIWTKSGIDERILFTLDIDGSVVVDYRGSVSQGTLDEIENIELNAKLLFVVISINGEDPLVYDCGFPRRKTPNHEFVIFRTSIFRSLTEEKRCLGGPSSTDCPEVPPEEPGSQAISEDSEDSSVVSIDSVPESVEAFPVPRWKTKAGKLTITQIKSVVLVKERGPGGEASGHTSSSDGDGSIASSEDLREISEPEDPT